jgi:hypothetical protein
MAAPVAISHLKAAIMQILFKRRLVLAALLFSGAVVAAPKATERLQRALHKLPGARTVNSMTGEGLVQVEIGFERDAIEADLELVRQLVLQLKWENLAPSIQFHLVGEKLN